MDNFSWIPLYTELATKLLDFKENRPALVEWIYGELGKVTKADGQSLVNYLKMKDGSKIKDIDPFSVFGIFNRSTSWEKRTELLRKFKEHFGLSADVPTDFNGIPTLDARRSFFFSWESNNEKVIHDQWELYEKIIEEEDAEIAFNQVIENGMARYSLTMCLFWIAPTRFLSLDSRNRSYLDTYGFPEDYPTLRYADYKALLEKVQAAMDNGSIPCSSFLEFSHIAWQAATTSPRVWMWNGGGNTFSQSTLKAGSSAKGQLDFASFTSKDALGAAYRDAVGNTDVKIPYAYWDFISKVKTGDIVVVFGTRKQSGSQYHQLYGWGRFTSECIFDQNDENPIQRTVEWHQPLLEEPVIEKKTKNDIFFHLVEGIEADNIIRLLQISGDYKPSIPSPERKYWLVGYSFGSTNSQFDRFVENSIWEGRFDDDSSSDQKLLPLAQSINVGDVLILKSTSTKGTKHDQSFIRVKAVAVVAGTVKTEKLEGTTLCNCEVKYYGIEDHDFDDPVLGSYRKSIHLADAKAKPLIDYANSLIDDNMPQSKYKEYIDLLNENYNLILTGSPGTGKTYMAKGIAEEMDAEWEFVQFHPSYDYTDFVEGLRPVGDSGNFGFELRNGVFKDFCARALQNLQDSKKSLQALQKETSVRDILDEFLEDAIEFGKTFKTVGTKNNFHVVENKERTVIVNVPANEKTSLVKLPKSDLITLMENKVDIYGGKDIQEYFHRKHRTQQDSYVYVLYNQVKNYEPKKKPIDVSLIKLKKFVFIIDEINRGEISKIFGELFFSIDPGYRGEKGRVNTQYQNMIEDDDVFKNGFFVPENVYIIGTMNDIDRSVESMDFAMRRRFAWREVTAEESMVMLDTMKGISKDTLQVLKNRMLNLNKAIADTEGLNEAYQIGAAYFLKYAKYNDFELLWKNHLKGLLSEYLRGNRHAKEQLDNLYTAYSKETVGNDEDTADNEG